MASNVIRLNSQFVQLDRSLMAKTVSPRTIPFARKAPLLMAMHVLVRSLLHAQVVPIYTITSVSPNNLQHASMVCSSTARDASVPSLRNVQRAPNCQEANVFQLFLHHAPPPSFSMEIPVPILRSQSVPLVPSLMAVCASLKSPPPARPGSLMAMCAKTANHQYVRHELS